MIPRPVHSNTARWVAATAALTTAMTLMSAAPTAHARSLGEPINGSFSISGSGYGHGWGMSQHGARGAAESGLTSDRIVAFYYPGTRRVSTRDANTLRVWITADTDRSLTIKRSRGLKITRTNGTGSIILPADSNKASWRITRTSTRTVLAYAPSGGKWVYYRTLGAGTWEVSNTARLVDVVMPDRSVKRLRERVQAAWYGQHRTVNRLPMWAYLRSVVPSEMPALWHGEALEAQAIAARTYALRLKRYQSNSAYDVCDTTACQVYNGYQRVSASGQTRSYEHSRTTSAIQRVSGQYLSYRSAPALTQYSASNGGASAKGSQPYLRAQPDPYDGKVTSQAWSKQVTTSTVAAKYPQVGVPTRLQVLSRDGSGSWGGRVTSIRIVGSKGSVTVTGNQLRSKLGMRSALFTVR